MISILLGWLGNLFIVAGLWGIGNKQRRAFLFSIVGESLWVIKSLSMGLYDLAFICLVFLLLAIRSYRKWSEA